MPIFNHCPVGRETRDSGKSFPGEQLAELEPHTVVK